MQINVNFCLKFATTHNTASHAKIIIIIIIIVA